MKTSFLKVIQSLPKWKVSLYLVALILLTLVTAFVVSQSTMNFILSSVTLNGLYHETINLIGVYKFMDLQQKYGPFLYFLFHCLIFAIYLILIYQNQKRKWDKRNLQVLIQDIEFIAEGNFDYTLSVSEHNDLGDLANNINLIVEKLKKSMEEERLAEQAKKDLITNVSHDLRTPLTSIIGYLGLIDQDKYKDEIELRYYVQTAFEKADRLHKLIDDLFEYTRVQNGGLKVRKERINISEMLGQLSVQFRFQLSDAGMECRISTPKEKLMVEADGTKLARVFENLIGNAIKYGRDGKYIDIVASEENQQVQVDIINYGNAIPSMDLPFIFERFYRVEKSRSESDNSSGLGLAIAKGIVELHGGTIEVRSDYQKTVFTVKLVKMESF